MFYPTIFVHATVYAYIVHIKYTIMKWYVIIGLVTTVLLSCDPAEPIPENNTCTTAASFVGYDLAMCPCCGGVFVQIDSVTHHVSDFSFTTDQTVLDSLADGFQNVHIDWEPDTTICLSNAIKITCITLD